MEVYGVKPIKLLPVFSIAFAVALSLSAVALLGEPQNTSVCRHTDGSGEFSIVGIAKAEANSALLDLDRLEQIINKNRVFDDFIYDDSALIDEAKFILADEFETVDGTQVIKCETVAHFVSELYGRELAQNGAEFYPVSTHGYTEIVQKLTDAVVSENGTVTVTSNMFCGESEAPVKVQTVLCPADNSYGYVVCSAKILEK